MRPIRLYDVAVLTILLVTAAVPLASSWVKTFGGVTTGEIDIENPVLAAQPGERLILNDLEMEDNVETVISGQEVRHFSSQSLPGQEINGSRVNMLVGVRSQSSSPQTLNARLRYTNRTGTFVACQRTISINRPSYRHHNASCVAQISSDGDVKYEYELIGAPDTNYTVSVNGSTFVELVINT